RCGICTPTSCGSNSSTCPSWTFLSCAWRLTIGSLYDGYPRKRQTATATPAEPGGLLREARAHNDRHPGPTGASRETLPAAVRAFRGPSSKGFCRMLRLLKLDFVTVSIPQQPGRRATSAIEVLVCPCILLMAGFRHGHRESLSPLTKSSSLKLPRSSARSRSLGYVNLALSHQCSMIASPACSRTSCRSTGRSTPK